jgi:hypothetical protein
VPALIAAMAFTLDGIPVSNLGFAGTSVANLASRARLALFAAITTTAAWWPRDTPSEHTRHPQPTRGSRGDPTRPLPPGPEPHGRRRGTCGGLSVR